MSIVENEKKPFVVVVGAGFGGMRAVSRLRKAPVKVVLVDRHNYHLFQPLLYQVAMAGLSPSEVAKSARFMLRGQKNAEFRLAEVTGVDLESRTLHTTLGDIRYDYLVLSFGSESNTFGLSSVEKNSLQLKDIDDALAIRNHILRMFELAAAEKDARTRQTLLTFVVAGGGPTGVETSGAISELIRLALVRDYPGLNLDEVRVLLLEAAGSLLSGFPEKLQKAAEKTLERKHVEVRFGAAVNEFDGRQVVLKSGEVIPSYTLLWAAGVQAESLAAQIPAQKNRINRLVVEPSLQLPGHPEVFVIGDAAYMEDQGEPLPMVAPVALQQANIAVENILRMIQGQPVKQFVYKDPGSLATIGRNAAVARIGRFQFSGFLAWAIWLVVHIYGLIGFRNRLVVLINWALEYIFYDRAVLIISPEGTKKQNIPIEH